MKNITKILFIAFLFYFIGHMFWSFSLFLEMPLFFKKHETLILNMPFSFFAIFSLVASYKLYKHYK